MAKENKLIRSLSYSDDTSTASQQRKSKIGPEKERLHFDFWCEYVGVLGPTG